NEPNSGGYLDCKPLDGRRDVRPSAGVCIHSDNGELGYYKDFGGTHETLSLFDLRIRQGKAKNFSEALKYYAERASVTLPRAGKKQEQTKRGLLEQIEPIGSEYIVDPLIEMWCKTKPPIT